MLITSADAATALGVTNDATFQRRHKAVERAIKGYCGREFERAQRTEIYRAFGHDAIFLRETPIVSIDEIRIDYTGEFAADTIVTDLTVFSFGAPVASALIYRGDIFPEAERAVQVKYTAGYITEVTGYNVPEDLQQVVLDVLKQRITQNGAERYKSESYGSHSITRFDTALDPVIRAELARYRRV